MLTWTDEVYYQRKAEAEVRGWFERAKASGMASINLYYAPNAAQFSRLALPVRVFGVETSLWLYQGDLYEVRAGSGDCEENLWFVGKCEENSSVIK